ncbi:putative addiction module killer protein [Halopseudomonas yangmingensis]|uniref:Putative addiction module killer protein n=1 Tax=Halopseudomonas yangmingensis TaxID=1720063 RepID=A0A1I4RJP3_9GAMM|nr:putative addiction module killer protein [Halopseudomonas yangmingensis]
MHIEIKRLPEFDKWLSNLKDQTVKARLIVRLKKAALGNLGDVKPVGEGVSEMREHFGTGWRMYFIQRGEHLIVMLGGGGKSRQSRDINKAIALSKKLED